MIFGWICLTMTDDSKYYYKEKKIRFIFSVLTNIFVKKKIEKEKSPESFLNVKIDSFIFC